MSTNKKVLKGGVVLSLLAALVGLASCTDVEASLTPAQEATKLLDVSSEIDDNTMKQIYDATVTAGDTNSEKVLDNVLLILAKNQLGSFYGDNGLYDLFTDNGTLYDESAEDQVNKLAADESIKSFLSSHKSAYYGQNGEITDASTKEAVKKAIIFTNFLIERINRNFMSYTDDATYCENNRFFEESFYQHIQKELWDLKDVEESNFKGVVDGKSVGVPTGMSSLSYDANSGYGTTYVKTYFQDDYINVYGDYIDRSMLPSLMRKALVQQYLVDNNSTSFGRSNARKVQYIALADNSNYPSSVRNLVKAYANLVLEGGESGNISLDNDEMNAIANQYGTASNDLHFLNDLVKGYTENWNETLKSAAKKVYSAAQFTEITVKDGDKSYTACQETTYGSYLSDYAKLTDSRYTNDSSVQNDFTNTGKHTQEVGLQMKVDALTSVDKTVCGWYTDSGLSELPTTYKTRLFKVTVANDLEITDADSLTPTYGTFINGDYYLTRTTYQSDEKFPYLLYDEDSSTWYICRVDEAVKSSKMKEGGYYDTKYGTYYRYELERQISYLLSDNSSYTKSANQYYVEKALIYSHLHDDYVYDYFESTFPDLFD